MEFNDIIDSEQICYKQKAYVKHSIYILFSYVQTHSGGNCLKSLTQG